MKHLVNGKIVETLRKTLTGFIGETPNSVVMDVIVSGTATRPTYRLTTPEMSEADISVKIPKLPFADRVSKVSVVWDEDGVLTITELEHNSKTVLGSTPNVRPEIAAHRLAK